MTHRSRAMRGRILKGAAPARALPAVLLGCLLAGTFTACTSGDGGDNGGAGSPDTGTDVGANNPDQPAGLAFSYPVDGQTDVYPGTTIAFAFSGDAAGDVQLVDTRTGKALPASVVDRGNGIFNLYPADSDARMAPATTYAVVAQGNIGDDDNTEFTDGDTLFAFTTAAAGGAATSSDFTLVNFPMGTDAGFPINGESFPFTQFNTLRARFSQPVDEGSVKLCTGSESLGDDNCTVAVTGPDGSNVAGRLSVLGKDFVFDPGSINPDPSNQDADQYDGDDLQAGVQYTVNFDDDFVSASGNSLSGTDSFNVTPLGINTGDRVDVVQRLRIGVIGNDDDDNDSMSSPLTGRTANNIELASQLIGSYDLAAVPSPEQGGLQVRLAAFNGQRFGGKIPTVLPRGQKFLLQDFNLALGSQLNDDGTFTEGQVDTPVNLDNLEIQFANDSDVYLLANDLSNIETPTRVAQRLDLNIFGRVGQNNPIEALSNGVVNQTALNVLASGIAVPQDNGDVALVVYGSFPISVNRDGEAAVNFELELTLPASVDDQPDIVADMTSPRITAQYPSACIYTFNAFSSDDPSSRDTVESGGDVFESGSLVGGIDGTTTLSAIEANCIQAMNERVLLSAADPSAPDETLNFPSPWANSLPLQSSPSILFSEPVDPNTARANISLIRNDEAGNVVPATIRTEGASVVIKPIDALAPDTQYEVMVGQGVTDLAGNALSGTFPGGSVVSKITFTTEPMVVPTNDNGSYVNISEDLSQRPAVRQTAPYVTALTPGMPCSLQTSSTDSMSDFMTGGNIAGRCAGDTPRAQDTTYPALAFGAGSEPLTVPASPAIEYPVFKQPANQAVTAYFSKPVRSDSLQLANGCLVGGSGNSNDNATIAVQRIDSNGACTGIVEGELSILGGHTELTRGFTFKPAAPLTPGQRYWTVICGSTDSLFEDGSNCSTGQTVIGQSGLALNTTPLRSSGTQIIGNSCTDLGGPIPNCLADYRGQGGPDIVMPFDGAVATADYLSTTRALAETDTNGNGFFDNSSSGLGDLEQSEISAFDVLYGGQNTGEDRGRASPEFADEFGRERAQLANSAQARTLAGLLPLLGIIDPTIQAPAEVGYIGGARPIRIGESSDSANCSLANQVTFDDGTGVIGSNGVDHCLPVDLPPGGLLSITSLSGGIAPTGRLFLRFPSLGADAEGNAVKPQRGYIVPKCSGNLNDEQYEYSPCFVASLTLTVNGPDTQGPLGQANVGLEILQQNIQVDVFGPVAFEQNGRLVISTKNANRFVIAAFLNGVNAPLPAPTAPGGQALQLVGAPIHGGPAIP